MRAKPGEARRYFEEVVLTYNGEDCLIWPFSKNTAGYGKLGCNGRYLHVHRMTCEAIKGPPPTPEHEAAHSCGKGHLGCTAPGHLDWKTPSQNNMDKLQHGTDNRGEKHPMAKLTEAQVLEIMSLKGTKTQAQIGAQYGVDRRHVGLIHRGKTWRGLALRTGAYEQKRSAA